AADVQLRFNLLLKDLDITLEFAREKFADLLVDSVHVGNQDQPAQQQNQRHGDSKVHLGLRQAAAPRLDAPGLPTESALVLARVFRSISPVGSPSARRSLLSFRAILPLSLSWS